MEDGISSRGNLITAKLATIDLLGCNAVMLGGLLALDAVDAVGPTCVFQKF